MILRWRRQEAATGLARVCAGFRCWYYGPTREERFITISAEGRYGTGNLRVTFYPIKEKFEQKYLPIKLLYGGVVMAKRFTDNNEAKLAALMWFNKNRDLFIERTPS